MSDDRWATFDCYGTLVDWEGGMRAAFKPLFEARGLTPRPDLTAQYIQYEMLGLGPLEPLLADPTVSDILVNGCKQVYVERRGKLELTRVSFVDNDHLFHEPNDNDLVHDDHDHDFHCALHHHDDDYIHHHDDHRAADGPVSAEHGLLEDPSRTVARHLTDAREPDLYAGRVADALDHAGRG